MSDIVVGAPWAAPGGTVEAGTAVLLSGLDGSTILGIAGTSFQEFLGSAVAGHQDVNSDGIPDFVVGAPFGDAGPLQNTGLVHMISGATGGALWTTSGSAAGMLLGTSLESTGDLDFDGVPDVLAGATGAQGASGPYSGAVVALSGADGTPIWTVFGPWAGAELGTALAATADINGDGVFDLATGAPLRDIGPSQDCGSVVLLDGATGGLIRVLAGTQAGAMYGAACCSVPDIDGDQVADLIIGAPGASVPGRPFAGAATCHSGASGALLWAMFGAQPFMGFCSTVSAAGDLDGDGMSDLLIGAPYAAPGGMTAAGAVIVASGTNGAILRILSGVAPGDRLGSSLASGRAMGNPGQPAVFLGADAADRPGAPDCGSVRRVDFDPLISCSPGDVFSLTSQPLTIELDFPTSNAGKPFRVLASSSGTGPTTVQGVPIPLGPGLVLQASIQGAAPAAWNWSGVLDGNGDAVASISGGPALAPLVGHHLWIAAVAAGTVAPLVSASCRLLVTP